MTAVLMMNDPASGDDGGWVSLDSSLRYVLGPKLFGTDGTIGGTTTADRELLPFLRAEERRGTKDAAKLAAAIERLGEVLITWEH